jgi:glutamate racemase
MGPIGVFDSGLGGLTVLRELQRRLPAEDLLYFGDTARVPYGTKGERTVRAFALQDANFLVAKGVKMIVVACNTASAFALDYLSETLSVPVLGVIEPGVRTALEQTRGGRIGVIATRGTVNSDRYQQLLSKEINADRIVPQACPLFVPLAEEGLTTHEITQLTVAEYLKPMRDAEVDTLILGCTHYPILKEAIGAYMGPDVTLVDSAQALAQAAAKRLEETGLARGNGGTVGSLEFYLSDLPWKFKEIAERFLGHRVDNVHIVNLNELELDRKDDS